MATHAVVRIDGYRRSTLIGLKRSGLDGFIVFTARRNDYPDVTASRAGESYGAWCGQDAPDASCAWKKVEEVDCPECAAHVVSHILNGDHNGLGYQP